MERRSVPDFPSIADLTSGTSETLSLDGLSMNPPGRTQVGYMSSKLDRLCRLANRAPKAFAFGVGLHRHL